MVTTYKAIEGERLDQIVFNFYGSIKLFEVVLENNPHLKDKPILSADDEVTLEEIEPVTTKTTEENVKALW